MYDVENTIKTVLCALYLRQDGVDRASLRHWTSVVGALRRFDRLALLASVPGAWSDELRESGLWEEASRIEGANAIAAAIGLLRRGEAITALCPAYPRRWFRALGPTAPPAFHARTYGQSLSVEGRATIGVVGSRLVSAEVRRAAYAIGRSVAECGASLVSGGAFGCDRAAADGAWASGGRIIEILPYGFESISDEVRRSRIARWRRRQQAVPGEGDGPARRRYEAWSVCAPGDGFSAAAAMERNALVYAACDCVVVVHARFGEGGTWTGAREAIRRRLSELVVWAPSTESGVDDRAVRSLVGLGATPLTHLERMSAVVGEAIAGRTSQLGLFSAVG